MTLKLDKNVKDLIGKIKTLFNIDHLILKREINRKIAIGESEELNIMIENFRYPSDYRSEIALDCY